MRNRKWWLAGAGVAAVLALVLGTQVGQGLIESRTEPEAPEPALKRFHEPITDVSISYPAAWTPLKAPDGEVRLLVAADESISLLMRVTKTDFADVNSKNVGVLRTFTDDLLGQDKRAKLIGEPRAIELSGLPGHLYRYTYVSEDGTSGAHVHYFLFKRARMIQLVFQAQPAERLSALNQTFDGIAATFKGDGR